MSLSALLTAVNELIGNVIVNDCGRPVPDRVLRYHTAPPNICCSDNGMLATFWETGYTSATFPANTGGSQPCNGPFVTPIATRYVVCWPKLEVNQTGVTLPDERFDAQAAMLADVAECVADALVALTCNPDRSDAFVAAVLAISGPRLVRFADVNPLPPRGLCAGVVWRLYSAVGSAPAPEPPVGTMQFRTATDGVGVNVT